jgi:ribosomal protein S18 acetylase RimI-like enzyme
MQSTVVIAAASAADIPVVQRLAGAIWRQHYPGILSVEQIEYMLAQSYSYAALERFVTAADAGLALARVDGEAAGFAAWYRTETPTTVKLDKLYVLLQFQGEGLGRTLIDVVAAQARTRGCDEVTLNVNRGNAGAIRAYERCGFVIRARGDFPIGAGFVMEDFIMVRALHDR